MSDNPVMNDIENALNASRDIAERNRQVFAGLAIYGIETDEKDVLDKATVSISYSENLPRETQRAMLKIAYKLIGSMLGE